MTEPVVCYSIWKSLSIHPHGSCRHISSLLLSPPMQLWFQVRTTFFVLPDHESCTRFCPPFVGFLRMNRVTERWERDAIFFLVS